MKRPKQIKDPYSILIVAEQETALNEESGKQEVLQPLTDIDLDEMFSELKSVLLKYKMYPDKLGYTDKMLERLTKIKISEYDK